MTASHNDQRLDLIESWLELLDMKLTMMADDVSKLRARVDGPLNIPNARHRKELS